MAKSEVIIIWLLVFMLAIEVYEAFIRERRV